MDTQERLQSTKSWTASSRMNARLAKRHDGSILYEKTYGSVRHVNPHSTLIDFTQWMNPQKLMKVRIQCYKDFMKKPRHQKL